MNQIHKRLLSSIRVKDYFRAIKTLQLNEKQWTLDFSGKLMKVPGTDAIIISPSKLISDLLLAEFEGDVNPLKLVPSILTPLIYRASLINHPENKSLRQEIVSDISRYIHTDTLCYFENDPEVYQKQCEVWIPIIRALEEKFAIRIKFTRDFSKLEQNPATVQIVENMLNLSTVFTLSAFEYLTRSMKSVLLPLALQQELINLPLASQASNLEHDEQAKRWGVIPESHKLLQLTLQRQIALSSLLLQ